MGKKWKVKNEKRGNWMSICIFFAFIHAASRLASARTGMFSKKNAKNLTAMYGGPKKFKK